MLDPRASWHDGGRCRFGVFEFDVRALELHKSGRLVAIRPQPLKVLARLLTRPGELVTREDLERELWGDDTFVDFEQGVNHAIRDLRAALGDAAESPRFIQTLPRRGYRFIAPVTLHHARRRCPCASRRRAAADGHRAAGARGAGSLADVRPGSRCAPHARGRRGPGSWSCRGPGLVAVATCRRGVVVIRGIAAGRAAVLGARDGSAAGRGSGQRHCHPTRRAAGVVGQTARRGRRAALADSRGRDRQGWQRGDRAGAAAAGR